MLRIIFVVSPGQQNNTRFNETANIINMAVGLIIINTPGQPDYFLDIQEVAQVALDRFTVEMRITIGVKQTFFGSEQGTLSIDMD